jgi:GAF domain-containing protein
MTNRTEIYQGLHAQLKGLLEGEDDLVASLANTAALISQELKFFWVGFYLVKNNELVLGPFQGPVACTRIQKGKGVCGSSWQENKTLLVPDVHEFPGHIACSAHSQSEIVIPIRNGEEVTMVLDVDSNQLDDFSEDDKAGLEKLMHLLQDHLYAA